MKTTKGVVFVTLLIAVKAWVTKSGLQQFTPIATTLPDLNIGWLTTALTASSIASPPQRLAPSLMEKLTQAGRITEALPRQSRAARTFR